MTYFLDDLVTEAKWCLEESKKNAIAASKTPFWRWNKRQRYLENADLLMDEAEDIINQIRDLKAVLYS